MSFSIVEIFSVYCRLRFSCETARKSIFIASAARAYEKFVAYFLRRTATSCIIIFAPSAHLHGLHDFPRLCLLQCIPSPSPSGPSVERPRSSLSELIVACKPAIKLATLRPTLFLVVCMMNTLFSHIAHAPKQNYVILLCVNHFQCVSLSSKTFGCALSCFA